ncbi:hypothetical protein NG800_015785, partial [Epilithonimonas ginsengisoli]
MKLKLILLLLLLPFFSNAQTLAKTNSGIKIYSYQSSVFENKFWLTMYKIDWDSKTIQYAQIHFNEGEKISDLKSVTQIFRNAVSADKFIFISPDKIKVERMRRNRSWLNFATPRVKSSSAERYFINGDTLTFGKGKKAGEYVFDKELTLRYQQEKKNNKLKI